MSSPIASQPVKQHRAQPGDARCSCGKLREECVRLMVRRIWRAYRRPYWHRAA